MVSEADLDISKATSIQKKKALNYAIEVRKAEIDRFWSRTIVFWGFVGATFVAFGALYKETHTDYVPLLIVSCFGFVSSLAWTLQNRGSKYWQEAWEHKVGALETEVLEISLFTNRERLQKKGWWGANRSSVSKLVVAMSDLATVVWSVLAIRTFATANPKSFATLTAWYSEQAYLPSLLTAIVLFTSLYSFFMWLKASSS